MEDYSHTEIPNAGENCPASRSVGGVAPRGVEANTAVAGAERLQPVDGPDADVPTKIFAVCAPAPVRLLDMNLIVIGKCQKAMQLVWRHSSLGFV